MESHSFPEALRLGFSGLPWPAWLRRLTGAAAAPPLPPPSSWTTLPVSGRGTAMYRLGGAPSLPKQRPPRAALLMQHAAWLIVRPLKKSAFASCSFMQPTADALREKR